MTIEEFMEHFLTQEEAAKRIGCSRQAMGYWRKHGTGPAWTRFKGRVLYRKDVIEAFVKSLQVEATEPPRPWTRQPKDIPA